MPASKHVWPIAFAFGCALFGARASAQQALPLTPPADEESAIEPPIDPQLEGFGDSQPPVQPSVSAPPPPAAAPALSTAPAAPPAAAPPAPSGKLFSGGGIAVLGTIGSSLEAALGFNAGSALFSIGVSMYYDPAGLLVAETHSADMLSFKLSASFGYMAYNRDPLAFGPELVLHTSLAPGPAFTTSTILSPGFALWYAPFRAPLLVGAALSLDIDFGTGRDPIVSTGYPGLRLRLGF